MASETPSPDPAEAMKKLGMALKRMGPSAQQATSATGQMARSVTLSQRRSLYRARIGGIRYRLTSLRQDDDRAARIELRTAHRAANRYMERCTLALLFLALVAGLAAIASASIGGVA